MPATQISSLTPDTAAAVTTSDTAPNVFTRLYIGGAGDVAVVTENGNTVTFKAVPVGTQLEIRVKQVLATGTTATYIVGML
jgi:hypothetical protein